LTGKTIVITGGNAGLGKETAKACARLGAKVIIACRDHTKGQETMTEITQEKGIANENVILVQLDLSSLASVRNCAGEILDMTESIDILINNAGIMMCPEWKTKDGLEHHFATNYLGHFLLTILLLPKLRTAPSARIVNVSSHAFLAGQIHFDNISLTGGYNSLTAYSQSKLAQVLFSLELSKRFKASKNNITAYTLHPGVVNTDILTHSPILRAISWAVRRMILTSPELGAQTTLHCALSEEAGNESGFYYE